MFGEQTRIAGMALMVTLTLACGDDKKATTSPEGDTSNVLIESQFDSGLDGWAVGTSPSQFGSVTWLDRQGGIVKLDAVGFDGAPNAWISKELELPMSTSSLNTSTSAHDRGDGAVSLRIRIVDSSANSHTIQDWTTLETNEEGFEFIDQSFDISAFAGETVTVYFEIADDDGGGNNQRYIDYIEIRE